MGAGWEKSYLLLSAVPLEVEFLQHRAKEFENQQQSAVELKPQTWNWVRGSLSFGPTHAFCYLGVGWVQNGVSYGSNPINSCCSYQDLVYFLDWLFFHLLYVLRKISRDLYNLLFIIFTKLLFAEEWVFWAPYFTILEFLPPSFTFKCKYSSNSDKMIVLIYFMYNYFLNYFFLFFPCFDTWSPKSLPVACPLREKEAHFRHQYLLEQHP